MDSFSPLADWVSIQAKNALDHRSRNAMTFAPMSSLAPGAKNAIVDTDDYLQRDMGDR